MYIHCTLHITYWFVVTICWITRLIVDYQENTFANTVCWYFSHYNVITCFCFLQLENKLVAFQTSEGGQLNEREFKEALDNLIPLCNERTRRRMYMQAEKAVRWDGIIAAVPIMRLARILHIYIWLSYYHYYFHIIYFWLTLMITHAHAHTHLRIHPSEWLSWHILV